MRGARISDISELSKAFKAKLLERFEDEPVRIAQVLTASDGTEKYLFALADGNIVEGVLMRYKYGNTQCVSTQVGCRMNCAFCASGLGGLVRDLTAGEILAQILVVNARLGGTIDKRAVTNVVLMGSGEPLDNYDNTVRFLRNVTAPGGICISARNISLSTCGLVPRMHELAEEGIPLNLTVSLHSHRQTRSAPASCPSPRPYKIADILAACDHYFGKDRPPLHLRVLPHRGGKRRQGARRAARLAAARQALSRQRHPPQRGQRARPAGGERKGRLPLRRHAREGRACPPRCAAPSARTSAVPAASCAQAT